MFSKEIVFAQTFEHFLEDPIVHTAPSTCV